MRHPKDFKCRQCGSCCRHYDDIKQITLSEHEYLRLIEGGMQDVTDYLIQLHVGFGIFIYDGWFNPKTGERLYKCPWLRKVRNKDQYRCRIYDARPDECHLYPQVEQREDALKIGCRGFEKYMKVNNDNIN